MRLPKPEDGVVWITGGSSGIGRALALRLAKAGWTVVISAPDHDGLKEVAASDPSYRTRGVWLDVTDEAAVVQAVADIEDRFGTIALAILNAGTFWPVEAATFGSAVFRTHIELNVMGVVHCLAAVLPGMRDRKLGQIAITGSITGFLGFFGASAYGLTKAGLINMAEALAPELSRDGVCLQICNPGFVATPLTVRNSFPMPGMITAEAAGEAYFRGLQRGHFEITFPRRLVRRVKLLRLLPYSLSIPLLRRMLPKR